ncbi:hypothetical protein [Streptomyces sp. MJP52]|uniref:hypothetical protein n=1 Tax=Streptomyces sp. MJP52 TaxID=2940555 RepID=UPI0024746ACB|nr:hypothetical protein [Streptomyces sp. MJP52]MDH6224144.1 hypothetical protein [Streptomyces sp. MJP52]
MDLTSVREVVDARTAGGWRPGDAWLAGGTGLFAEPRPGLLRLRDLAGLGWPPLTAGRDGLTVAATCTVAELLAFAEDPGGPWRADGRSSPGAAGRSPPPTRSGTPPPSAATSAWPSPPGR